MLLYFSIFLHSIERMVGYLLLLKMENYNQSIHQLISRKRQKEKKKQKVKIRPKPM